MNGRWTIKFTWKGQINYFLMTGPSVSHYKAKTCIGIEKWFATMWWLTVLIHDWYDNRCKKYNFSLVVCTFFWIDSNCRPGSAIRSKNEPSITFKLKNWKFNFFFFSKVQVRYTRTCLVGHRQFHIHIFVRYSIFTVSFPLQIPTAGPEIVFTHCHCIGSNMTIRLLLRAFWCRFCDE